MRLPANISGRMFKSIMVQAIQDSRVIFSCTELYFLDCPIIYLVNIEYVQFLCLCTRTVEGQIIIGIMGVEVREEEPRYQKHDHQKVYNSILKLQAVVRRLIFKQTKLTL